jgi:hypothetical protein
MSAVITDIWRQMMRRRLWPVALLLLGALVAVPMLLSSTPAPLPPAPAAPTTSGAKDDALAEPVVDLASTGEATGRRHVLGVRKDPFKPGKQPKVKSLGNSSSSSQSTTSAQTASTASSTSGSGTQSGSSSTGGGSSTGATPTTPSGPSATPPSSPTPPPAATPPAKKPTYPLYSIVVRFGDASADSLPKSRIKRLQPLPDAVNPVAIYLGPGPDKKSAVFLVDASVTPQGDGTCKPYAADCQTVTLHEGETEFFDVKDPVTGAVTSTTELDLVSIARKTTTSARRAKAASAPNRKGARALRKHVAEAGPLRWAYDRSSGTVAKMDTREWKATVARAGQQVARVVAVLQPGM